LAFSVGIVAIAGMAAVKLLLCDIFRLVNMGLSLLAAAFNLACLPFRLFDCIPRARISPWHSIDSIVSLSGAFG
jgi:hypothetical protein